MDKKEMMGEHSVRLRAKFEDRSRMTCRGIARRGREDAGALIKKRSWVLRHRVGEFEQGS